MVQLLCATITQGRDIYAGDNKHASACPSCSRQAACLRRNTHGKLILANVDWSQLHPWLQRSWEAAFSTRQLDCFPCLRLVCEARGVGGRLCWFYFDTWEPASSVRVLGHTVLGRLLFSEIGGQIQPRVAPLFFAGSFPKDYFGPSIGVPMLRCVI